MTGLFTSPFYIYFIYYIVKKVRLYICIGLEPAERSGYDMKSFIALKSSTAASKAQSVLNKLKIKAQTAKITDENGCIFGIRTDEDADKVCRILSLNGIVCMKIREDGK